MSKIGGFYAIIKEKGEDTMKHVKTLNTRKLQNTIKKGGCGECQTSCQSACKTSCTVGNQTCEQYKQSKVIRQSFEADRAPSARSFFYVIGNYNLESEEYYSGSSV